MKKFLLGLIAGGFIIAMTGVASADWIDLNEYFLDDVTGYTWMDVNSFNNMTPLEMQNVLSGTGFQLATSAQVNQMSGNRNDFLTGEEDREWYHNIGRLIIGSQSVNMAWGYTIESLDTTSSPHLWVSTVNDEHSTYEGQLSAPETYFGVWAVNTNVSPVPEPATMLLFGIGLLGLTGVNRRKK